MASQITRHQYSYENSKTREQALQLRVKVQDGHAQMRTQMRHFDESRENFMAMIQQGTTDLQMDIIKNADNQLKSDSDALKAAMDELHYLHQELSRLDYDLFSQEQNQDGGPNFIEHLLNSGQVPASTIESKTIIPVISNEDNELPPQLDEYFDVLGDINILRERLDYDMFSEHKEKIQERERRIDQDEELSTTDSEFELRLSNERDELTMQLETLKDRASMLHTRCLKDGLDPDPSRYARESDYGSSVGRNQSKVERWLGNQNEAIEHPERDGLHDKAAWSDLTPPATSPSQHSTLPYFVPTSGRADYKEEQTAFLGQAEQPHASRYGHAGDDEFSLGEMDDLHGAAAP